MSPTLRHPLTVVIIAAQGVRTAVGAAQPPG